MFQHHIFIISQLWLTSHPRSTVVLLDTGTPDTSREIYSEDTDDWTPSHNPLSSWCIASLYIYHFSTVVYFSSEKYSGSAGHRTPGTSREIYSEDVDDRTRTANPSQPLELATRGVASSDLIIGILTVNFSTGTRISCVQWNHCTSRIRSQPQLRNDKYIMMQYTNWINSTPSKQ